MMTLPKNVARIAKLADQNPGRFALSAVQVSATEGGYKVAATDAKVLGVITGPNEPGYPALPALAAAPNTATTALVPAGAFEAAFKDVPKGRRVNPALNNLAVVLGDKVTTFGTTDLERTSTNSTMNVEGRFPAYEQVFPVGPPRATVCLDPKILRELLAVAEAIAASDTSGSGCKVVLHVHDAERPVEVLARNDAGQEFRGLIMPLS